MIAMFEKAALEYSLIGFKVFPLSPGTKIPAVKGGRGFRDATGSADQIRVWAKQFPRANIGIATGAVSGVILIDIDPRNGGFDTTNNLASVGKVFPRCPTAKTGNGGKHLYFRYQPGDFHKTLGAGVDVKSDGGCITAAPSWLAPSKAGPGGNYVWLVSPDQCPLPPLPAWAVKALAKKVAPLPRYQPVFDPGQASRSLEGIARRIASAQKGTRNELLNWGAYQAGQLVRQGRIAAQTAETQLTAAALAAGLSMMEIRATIASGFKSALASSK